MWYYLRLYWKRGGGGGAVTMISHMWHSFLVWRKVWPACQVLGSDGSCPWQGAFEDGAWLSLFAPDGLTRGPYWRGPWPYMPRRPSERLGTRLWVSAVTNGPPEVQANQLASSACVMALPPGSKERGRFWLGHTTGVKSYTAYSGRDANSKHWFTTSFLQGGRCRKAVLGVWPWRWHCWQRVHVAAGQSWSLLRLLPELQAGPTGFAPPDDHFCRAHAAHGQQAVNLIVLF